MNSKIFDTLTAMKEGLSLKDLKTFALQHFNLEQLEDVPLVDILPKIYINSLVESEILRNWVAFYIDKEVPFLVTAHAINNSCATLWKKKEVDY